MVRLKHRYLLVNILYPDGDTSRLPENSKYLPAVVEFRRPSPHGLTAGLLVRHIREHVELLYGDYGMGVTGSSLSIKYFSPATSTFIVRCPVAHYRLIWAALTFMIRLPRLDYTKGRQQPPLSTKEHACVMRVVRVSGTIRKSEEEAIRRARADILKARRETEDPGAVREGSSTLDRIFGAEVDLPEAPSIEDEDLDDDEDEDEGEDEDAMEV